MTKPLIKIENLSYTYGLDLPESQQFTALRDLTLTIDKAEIVAITGSSGSGKSTLMNLLGTLATTTEGVLEINGSHTHSLEDLDLAALRNRTIGFVFQQFHLLPRLSVLENVLLPLGYLDDGSSRATRKRYEERALFLLNELGIAEQAQKKPAELSGGQKQRVAIARALLLDPDIILADEPTGALDSRTSAEVLGILQKLNRQGKTVIIITHDPDVTAIARREIRLQDGQILWDKTQTPKSEGKTEDIKTEKNQVSVRGRRSFLPGSWYDAWQALMSARLRTVLTSLGLLIGVSSITIMLTLGTAAQNVILGIFNQAGSDRIYVGLDWRAAKNNGQGYWQGLDVFRELPAMQNTFKDYGRIVPLGWGGNQNMYAAGNQYNTRVAPLYSGHDFQDKGMKVEKGRAFAPLEYENGARIALVGSDFTEAMFPANYQGRFRPDFPIGEKIHVRDSLTTTLTIVGVLAPKDTTFESRDSNSRLYLPLKTLTNYTGSTHVTWISVVPNKGVEHRWLADSVKNYLEITNGMRYPFRAHVPEEIISRIMLFIKVFQGLTALVGGLCILVGGIGIMNIMLVTIAERIREIGLRKALGAKNRDITRQFLTECILLCLVSGIMGTLIGLVFCNFVAWIGHKSLPDTIPAEILLNPVAVTLGLATAIGAGTMFGMMPALKASRLDPSEALRSE